MADAQISHDTEADLAHKARWVTGRVVIYGILLIWTLVCRVPISWAFTTSFKMAPDVMKGNVTPFWDCPRKLPLAQDSLLKFLVLRVVCMHTRTRDSSITNWDALCCLSQFHFA